MLVGLYFFCVCVYVAKGINDLGFNDTKTLDNGRFCDRKELVPEPVFKYIEWMVGSNQMHRLHMYMITMLFLYFGFIIGASFFFGTLITWGNADSSQAKVFFLGLLAYMMIDIVGFMGVMVIMMIKSFIYSFKQRDEYAMKVAEDDDDDSYDGATFHDRMIQRAKAEFTPLE